MCDPYTLSGKYGYGTTFDKDKFIQDRDIRMITKFIEAFYYNLKICDELPQNWKKIKFEETCLRISSLLAGVSDTSLSEIDDLMIPELERATTLNLDHYKSMSWTYQAREKFDGFEVTILRFIKRLQTSDMITSIWLTLKIMRVVTDMYKDWLNKCKEKYEYPEHVILWISKLKNIPQAKCPREQRITSWISRQSEIILDRLDFSCFPNFEHKFSTWTLDPESYVCTLMAEDFGPPFLKIDYLHSYFMSASDDNEKVKLIESFVKGCVLAPMGSPRYKDNFPSEHVFLRHTRDIVALSLAYVIGHMNRHVKKQWDEIEKHYSFHLEPYLSEYSSVGVQSYSHQQLAENFENSLNLKNDDKPDLTIKKYLYCDGTIKSLQLISILHTAFLMSADILKMETFPENYESLIFRCSKNFKFYAVGFFDGSFNHNSLMPLFRSVQICPFVVLSQRHMYLKEDLLRWFKGESIDEETITEIFFALEDKPHYVGYRRRYS